MKTIIQYFLFALSIFSFQVSQAEVKEYQLEISEKRVNYTGNEVQAIAVNNSIPAPTLYFTEGDIARINVKNELNVSTSIHWHGLLVPNNQDGVPFVTNFPIDPQSNYQYEFELKHAGTYWYHSHSELQEQQGVYGAIVIFPKEVDTTVSYDEEHVMVLSDWTDDNPTDVLKNLKKDGDFYAQQKGSMYSFLDAIRSKSVKAMIRAEWTRMGPMDLSDVGYDAFLTNGTRSQRIPYFAPGSRVRIRIVNAAASSYFHLNYAGGKMTVISADGVPVEPKPVDQALIAVAETYDVVIEIPDDGKLYEFRATSQDVSGITSTYFGEGDDVVYVPDHMRPNPWKMMNHGGMGGNGGMGSKGPMNGGSHAGHGTGGSASMPAMGGHTQMPHKVVLNYDMLKSPTSTKLPDTNPVNEITLNLTGNMERYVWTFNNKPLSAADKILIRKGQNVKVNLVNKTMMHHPMHLHGHFFRVVNKNRDFSPLKHTVDVKPMMTTVIEFLANEEKDWFFHCHNLYHVKTGMARVFRYEDSEIDPAIEASKKNYDTIKDTDWYYRWDVALLSNQSRVRLRASNLNYAVEGEGQTNYRQDHEARLTFEKNITRFLDGFAEVQTDYEKGEIEYRGILGLKYRLPMLIDAKAGYDVLNNKPYFSLERELAITRKIWLDVEYEFVDLQHEYSIGARYRPKGPKFSLGVEYDSEIQGLGGGLNLVF